MAGKISAPRSRPTFPSRPELAVASHFARKKKEQRPRRAGSDTQVDPRTRPKIGTLAAKRIVHERNDRFRKSNCDATGVGLGSGKIARSGRNSETAAGGLFRGQAGKYRRTRSNQDELEFPGVGI